MNVSPPKSLRIVQRKEKRKEIEIVKPRVSDVYTANMGGESGTNICFGFPFNLAACNAYILESESRVKCAQDLFHLELGKQLIINFSCRKRPASDALPLVSGSYWGAVRGSVSTAKLKGRKLPKTIQF